MSPLHLIVYAVLALAGRYCLLIGGHALLASGFMLFMGGVAKNWSALGVMLLMLCGSAVLLAAAFFLGRAVF